MADFDLTGQGFSNQAATVSEPATIRAEATISNHKLEIAGF